MVLETLVELFKLELLKTTNLKPKKLKLESAAKDLIYRYVVILLFNRIQIEYPYSFTYKTDSETSCIYLY